MQSLRQDSKTYSVPEPGNDLVKFNSENAFGLPRRNRSLVGTLGPKASSNLGKPASSMVREGSGVALDKVEEETAVPIKAQHNLTHSQSVFVAAPQAQGHGLNEHERERGHTEGNIIVTSRPGGNSSNSDRKKPKVRKDTHLGLIVCTLYLTVPLTTTYSQTLAGASLWSP